MNTLMNNKTAASVLLIVAGLLGLIFGPFVLGISALILIILGIFNIYKKSFDAGLIVLLIGIGLIFASRFLYSIIRFISMGCIIFGIILFIIYAVGKKD